MKRTLSVLLAIVFALSLAACGAMEAEPKEFRATVSKIQKYGNILLAESGSSMLAAGFAYGDIVTVRINGRDYEMPIGSSFSDVEQGGMICRVVIKEELGEDYISLAVNMGDLATSTGLAVKEITDSDPGYEWRYCEGVSEPVEILITMKEEGGFYDEWMIQQLSRSENREDYPMLSDFEFANFRMVAAGGIAPCRLYRSSSPINPEFNRNTYADKAAEEAGIRTVINLADDEEAMRAYEGYGESWYCGQDIIALGLGMDISEPSFREGLAEGLRFLAANDGPYLLHCNEGKDRSGFVCAVLECLMGATEDEVVADYMTTFYNYYGVEPGTKQYDLIAERNIIKSLCKAFGLESTDGAELASCAEEYLLSIGLTAEEINAVKSRLAERP